MNIIALHGFTGCGADFEPFAQQCIGTWHCPDLPGHGAANSQSCSPQSTVRSIQHAVDCLAQAEPKILVAYSMGARAALQHAIQSPTIWDALILFSPNPGIENEPEREQRRQADEALAQRMEAEGLVPFLEYWRSTPLIQSQQNIPTEWLQTMQSNRLRQSTQGLAQSLRQFGQGNCPNLWPKLDVLQIPLLCITGESDTKYSKISERIARELMNATHITIPEAGHMPHLEKPRASVETVNAFLRQFTN